MEEIRLVTCTASINFIENVAGIGLAVEVEDNFKLLFENIAGEEFLKDVCYRVQDDMIDDMTSLGNAIVQVMNNEVIVPLGSRSINIEIEMCLNSMNHIQLHTKDNVKEVYDGADSVKIRYMVEGIRKAYEHYHGMSTILIWEKYINLAFERPEEFVEAFTETEEE